MSPEARYLAVALMLGSCSPPPSAHHGADDEAQVRVEGLRMEIFEPNGRTIEITAGRGSLADLAGRGGGRFEDVAVRIDDGTSARLSVEAPRGRLDGTGAFELFESTAELSQQSTIGAEHLRIDPSGRVRARGVKARLRIE